MKKRRRRGLRRRNPRTQRPARIINSRTGVGRTTLLETSEWLRPPSGWDLAALAMRVQANEAKRKQEKREKEQRRATRERRKESKAEGWRRKYQKPSDSPFMRLPGMAGQSITHRRQPVISAEGRRQAGVAPRGPATTLPPALASIILTLRAQGLSYRVIGREVKRPEATVRHWLKSGRAEAAATDRG